MSLLSSLYGRIRLSNISDAGTVASDDAAQCSEGCRDDL